jgi:hypothetical protein
MTRFANRRDDCEAGIVVALRQLGASVHSLNDTGCPDLLVGFRGVNYLLECKDAHGKAGKGSRRTKSGLRSSQEDWFGRWKGAAPIIVTTPAEAATAIGAVVRGL